MTACGIKRLGPEVKRRGIMWVHMPITDVSTPGPEFEAKWKEASGRLRSRLTAGENILVHCRGGLGRAGMIAARLLVETGLDPEDAMKRVRAVRRGAIEPTRTMGTDGAATTVVNLVARITEKSKVYEP